MKFSVLRSLLSLAAVSVIPASSFGQVVPGDTYFSMAITENSHNHNGAKRLYLNFQEPPFAAPDTARGEIVSVRVAPGAITMDGTDAEWDPAYLTTIQALVQNNYPLSEYIDAIRSDVLVGSAWDATHVYFMVKWVDSGYDASTRRKKWIFGDQGAGETGWNQQVHIGATVGAPNEFAVNAAGHVLAGSESEDRVFFMFPIVDSEGNFTADGGGCAMYCHTNLATDFPWQNYTGTGVVAMHANQVGDTADIWHWKSVRTHPSGYADDKYLEYAVGNVSGRKSDAGSSAYSDNNLSGADPEWMHQSGLSYTGDALMDFESVLFSGSPLPGDEIPRHRSLAPTGSRGDVETSAVYDAVSKTWTVEFRRLRDTGNGDDHSFESAAAAAPTATLVTVPDAVAGATEYANNCMFCHGVGGAGDPDINDWFAPRVQRASGSLIHKAVRTVPSMLWLEGSLTEQQIEDIAAYLQTQAEFDPTWTLTVNVVGTTDAGAVTTSPPGIDCPGSCAFDFLDGTPVTLTANPVPGFIFTGWSGGPCHGTGDCNFTMSGDEVVTATYEADCNGNGTPDSQDISGGGSLDLNGNGIPDECECLANNYCVLNPNSVGPGAVIGFSGSQSVAANDFVLEMTAGPANQFSLFYYGPAPGSIPFGNGTRCVTGSTFRLSPPSMLDANGEIAKPLDFTQLTGAGQITPGSRWYFQCWYRDPAAGGSYFNLSDGLDVTFCP